MVPQIHVKAQTVTLQCDFTEIPQKIFTFQFSAALLSGKWQRLDGKGGLK